ncbi:MAG: tubulin-like doman-containing protein [Thermoanaerobaculia bacterium]|nr:tubulin-like doman-containing protein [Thermoanaerobaculia bacterium]
MSLELLLQATRSAKTEESKKASPTLLIGLGGTGKEVLLRLRRLLVERYGNLNQLPFLQFLHLDTDSTMNAIEQYDLKASDDPLFPKVSFSSAERIDLTIEGGTGKYVEHIDAYPHIKRWFRTDGKIAKLGNLGEGAGQVRIASRLGLYHSSNFNSLSHQLERAHASLKDTANLQRAQQRGFDLDATRINVYVIASLAGGTGGGVFLDIGFLLQRYFPSDDRMAILLLPGFFSGHAGGEGRMRANGYAALMELNHYSFGNRFHANWDGKNAEILPPPPFSSTYLIDNRNEAGLFIGSSGKETDAYRMCAEFLFQDFALSSFAGTKRATRINLVNFSLDVYTHNFLNDALGKEDSSNRKAVVGDTYPTRFGSFGLASIAFPTDRVHNACACRLARSILEFWEKTLLADPREALFTTFLNQPEVRFVQGSFERRDGGGMISGQDVEDALLWYDRGGSKTFFDHIWSKVTAFRAEIEAAPKGTKAMVLAAGLERLEQDLSKEDSQNPEEWGNWVRTIEENCRIYIDQLRRGITQKMEEVANDPRRGVAYALSLLRELKSLLGHENYRYSHYFAASVNSWVGQTQIYQGAIAQIRTDVAAHERRSVIMWKPNLAYDIHQLVADDKSEEHLGALYHYLASRIMRQVMRRGVRVCEAVDELLGKDSSTGKGLIGRYYQLLVNFQQLKDHLVVVERYFTTSVPSELTISLYEPGDVDRWYRIWLGKHEQEQEVLRVLGNELLTAVFKADSVTAALHTMLHMPKDQVEEAMLAHCKQYFSGKDEQPDALELLFDTDRLSTSAREEKIGLAYRLGKVWLARPERGIDHVPLRSVTADQRPCLIGVDQTDTRRFQELEQLIRTRIQGPSDSRASFRSLGRTNRGMIVFYNELAGVPAFYPSSVMAPAGLKEAYERFEEKDELHIDKNRFQFGEVLPKRNDEVDAYVDALRAFLLARLLGLLDVAEKSVGGSEQPLFIYSYNRPAGHQSNEERLGDEARAIDQLYRDRRAPHETDRRHLLDQVEETLQILAQLGHLDIYALLIEFYKKIVYPPHEGQVKEVDVTLVEYSPAYAVLDRAEAQIARLLPGSKEVEQFKFAFEQRRGKPASQALQYGEYLEILRPFTKPAGKVVVRGTSAIGVVRTVLLEVRALDLAKIDTRPKTSPPRQVAKQQTTEASPHVYPNRPCTHCGHEIQAPALRCPHCKTQTAQYHATCEFCGQDKVPDDLLACWQCGKPMPGKEERITCPGCFSYSGYRREFPCPRCQYDFHEGTPEEASAPEPPSGPFEENSGPSEEPSHTENGDPGLGDLVLCTNCWERVQPGPKCSECGSPLN